VCFGLVASQALVGIFSAAFAFSDVYPQWSYSASGAVLPVWTRLYERRRIPELVELRESLLDVVFLLSVPIAIALSVFAPQICALLGAQYAASALVLRIVAYRAVLSVFDGLIGHGFLIAINQVKQRQRAQAIALVVLATLTLVFGRLWGAEGVAIGLFIADSIMVLQYFLILSKLNLQIRTRFFLPVLLAGGAMALAAAGLPSGYGVAARAAAGILAYAGVLFLLSRHRVVDVANTIRHCFGGVVASRPAEAVQ
jgi:O-antigen/teichoic acid export membrane protein